MVYKCHLIDWLTCFLFSPVADFHHRSCLYCNLGTTFMKHSSHRIHLKEIKASTMLSITVHQQSITIAAHNLIPPALHQQSEHDWEFPNVRTNKGIYLILQDLITFLFMYRWQNLSRLVLPLSITNAQDLHPSIVSLLSEVRSRGQQFEHIPPQHWQTDWGVPGCSEASEEI